jgi:hypothetical protein
MTVAQTRTFISLLCDRVGPMVLHHGCCVGVDEQAHWFALEAGVGSIGHPPINKSLMMRIDGLAVQFDGFRPAKPYLDRNRDIVDESEVLIVVPKEEPVEGLQATGGTWYTYRYARRFGRPTKIIWPDGSTT